VSLGKDLVLAGRTLRKSPIFAFTAILTIALGVGASTAIFSVANAVLLRPLPYKNPEHLVNVMSDMRARNVRDFPISNENFSDLKDRTKNEFEDMTGVFTVRSSQPLDDGTSEQVRTGLVMTNFFSLVGAKIVAGRDFVDSDGTPEPPPPPGAKPGEPPPNRLPLMAILSYEYFQRRYGGDPKIIGQKANKGPFAPQIVGVLAPNFQLYFPPAADTEAVPEMWIANRRRYDNANRNSVSLHVIGRLRDGVTLERAQAASDLVAADLRKNFVILGTAGLVFRLEALPRHLVDEVRPAILSLMGAVIFLLLIACANVANLLLVRASLRQRELAIRTAIGANWWDLARQMLTEAGVLAAAGAAIGLALAWLGIHELRILAPQSLPRLDSILIDGPVLAFTAGAGLFAAMIFGMASAWRASRPDVLGALRGSSRNDGLASGSLLRQFVVVSEVALSFVLLIGSGLMFRSFLELQRVDPGFDPQGLMTFRVLGTAPKSDEEAAAVVRQIQQRLQNISGIQSVTATHSFPLTGAFLPVR
jgi:predicted permease